MFCLTCFWWRIPNPDAVVVVHTPSGVFAARSLLQNQKSCFRGSRLISSNKAEIQESTLDSNSNDFEPLSAARCHTFKRSNFKVMQEYYHFVKFSLFGVGHSWHLIIFHVFAKLYSLSSSVQILIVIFLLHLKFYGSLPEGWKAANIPPTYGAKTSFFRCSKQPEHV